MSVDPVSIPLSTKLNGGRVVLRPPRTTDIGALSTYTSLWAYDDFAQREERRAKLQANDDWKAFLAKIQPLIHTQQNRILIPTSFSPLR